MHIKKTLNKNLWHWMWCQGLQRDLQHNYYGEGRCDKCTIPPVAPYGQGGSIPENEMPDFWSNPGCSIRHKWGTVCDCRKDS